jgi:hypothetical protein
MPKGARLDWMYVNLPPKLEPETQNTTWSIPQLSVSLSFKYPIL